MELTVQHEPSDLGSAILAVSGDVTFSTAAELRRSLDEALEGSPRGLLVDISGVDFIDSSGLSALLTASLEMRRHGGRLALVHATGQYPSILRFKGVERLIDVFDSRDSALRELGAA